MTTPKKRRTNTNIHGCKICNMESVSHYDYCIDHIDMYSTTQLWEITHTMAKTHPHYKTIYQLYKTKGIWPSKTIENYTAGWALKKIGSGSYGTVSSIHNKDQDHPLQMVIKETSNPLNHIQSDMLREISILSTLRDCPFVIDLIGIKENKVNMIYLEHAKMSLDAYLPLNTGIEKQLVYLRMIYEIMSGVWYMHEKEIWHRDLKPANILITADEHVRITDFGLSRQGTSKYQRTSTHIVTCSYRAPELLVNALTTGNLADIAFHVKYVDLFAIGMIICDIINVLYPIVEIKKNHLSYTPTETTKTEAAKSLYNLICIFGTGMYSDDAMTFPTGLDTIHSTLNTTQFPTNDTLVTIHTSPLFSLAKSLCHPNPINRPTLSNCLQLSIFDPYRDIYDHSFYNALKDKSTYGPGCQKTGYKQKYEELALSIVRSSMSMQLPFPTIVLSLFILCHYMQANIKKEDNDEIAIVHLAILLDSRSTVKRFPRVAHTHIHQTIKIFQSIYSVVDIGYQFSELDILLSRYKHTTTVKDTILQVMCTYGLFCCTPSNGSIIAHVTNIMNHQKSSSISTFIQKGFNLLQPQMTKQNLNNSKPLVTNQKPQTMQHNQRRTQPMQHNQRKTQPKQHIQRKTQPKQQKRTVSSQYSVSSQRNQTTQHTKRKIYKQVKR